MAGYDWAEGKSRNAVAAEGEGLVTRSKITKAWLSAAGITAPVGFVRWMVARGLISPTEWHHTSSMFNRTNYYCAQDIAVQLDDWAEYGHLDVLRSVWADPKTRQLSEFMVRHTLSVRMAERVKAGGRSGEPGRVAGSARGAGLVPGEDGGGLGR